METERNQSRQRGKFWNLAPKAHWKFDGEPVCRIFPKKVELQALVKYYDVDGDGNICYEEFIRGLR